MQAKKKIKETKKSIVGSEVKKRGQIVFYDVSAKKPKPVFYMPWVKYAYGYIPYHVGSLGTSIDAANVLCLEGSVLPITMNATADATATATHPEFVSIRTEMGSLQEMLRLIVHVLFAFNVESEMKVREEMLLVLLDNWNLYLDLFEVDGISTYSPASVLFQHFNTNHDVWSKLMFDLTLTFKWAAFKNKTEWNQRMQEYVPFYFWINDFFLLFLSLLFVNCLS